MIYLWHRPIAELAATIESSAYDDEFHFDDGYDTALDAARLLTEAGRIGHFFLVTRWVGLPGFLSWGAVRWLRDGGHEIGNHTASHAWLGKLPWEPRLQEVRDAQEAIARNIGVTPVSFAYPFGRDDTDAARAVAEFAFARTRGIREVRARK